MKKGKIFVIEGVDGAGKTTQIELLKKEYLDFIFLKEPGSTKTGQEIRELILKNNLDTKTELMLFYSARNELILNTILALIDEGKNIIIDRFELSSYAYQIYGNQREDLKDFIDLLSEKIVPKNFVDKYIFLDLDVEISKEREEKRNEESSRFDKQGIEYFNRVRKGYKKEIQKYPHKIIDASKDIQTVFEEIKKEISAEI